MEKYLIFEDLDLSWLMAAGLWAVLETMVDSARPSRPGRPANVEVRCCPTSQEAPKCFVELLPRGVIRPFFC